MSLKKLFMVIYEQKEEEEKVEKEVQKWKKAQKKLVMNCPLCGKSCKTFRVSLMMFGSILSVTVFVLFISMEEVLVLLVSYWGR